MQTIYQEKKRLMMRNNLPKLVRDKIPEIIKRSGRTCEFRKADSNEIQYVLYSKLIEENREFFDNPSLIEAADIYEVFLCILQHSGFELNDVIHCANLKRSERGSFTNHLILESMGEDQPYS